MLSAHPLGTLFAKYTSISFSTSTASWTGGEWYHVAFIDKGTGRALSCLVDNKHAGTQSTQSNGLAGGLGSIRALRLGHAQDLPSLGASDAKLSFTGLIHSLNIWPSAVPMPIVLSAPHKVFVRTSSNNGRDIVWSKTAKALGNGGALFDGKMSTGVVLAKGKRASILPLRVEFQYENKDVVLSAITVGALRTSSNKCNADSGYQPPTDITLMLRKDASSDTWTKVQRWSAYTKDKDYDASLQFCCSASSVKHREPGCKRASVTSMLNTTSDTHRLVIKNGKGVAGRFFALLVTRTLGDSWVNTVEPALAEIKIEHLPNVTLVDNNRASFVYFDGLDQHVRVVDPAGALNDLKAFTLAVQFKRVGLGLPVHTEVEASKDPKKWKGILAEPLVTRGAHNSGDGSENDMHFFLGFCVNPANNKTVVLCADGESKGGGENLVIMGKTPIDSTWHGATLTYGAAAGNGGHRRAQVNQGGVGSSRAFSIWLDGKLEVTRKWDKELQYASKQSAAGLLAWLGIDLLRGIGAGAN